ncbi:MAG TPA: filamentous hemagglutinin N-terminal domain-containing protein, partial [Rhizomicrobium sp.]
NGQVWLINGNGILFGKGAQVNVGGLIATTSDIADRDFAAGNFSFGGGTGASVVNQGTIRARNGGAIVLSGAGVRNQGLIQADAGTVVLGGAAAFTVDFYGDNLLRYAITAPAGKADDGASGVTNSGTIKANNGGRVVMTARAAADVAGAVINNTGIVAATSARVQNGEVVLDGGDGDVNVAGSIDASGYGAGRSGGFVDVTGRNITVADNANIDVSGDSGGGRVRIGGDAHGAGPLPQAASVHVGRATISADATRRGDGGTLVVWSNGLTDFSGIASAMGGAEGGNGGFVETSGHVLQVGDGAKVTTLAPKGHTGLWLLDPSDIAIVDGGADGVGGSNIDPDTLIAALAGTDIALEAANTITVNSAVDYNSDNRLSLLAQNSITVNASIQNAGAGAIDLIAGWDGVTVDPAHFADAGVFAVGGAFNHSNVFFNTAAVGSHGGTTTVAGWQVSLAAFSNSAYSQIGYRGAEGGGGDIRVNTVSNLRLSTNSGVSNAVAQIGNGDKLGSVASNVTGNITLNVGNNLSLAMNAGGIGQAVWIGNASNGGTIAGDVAITTASFSDDSYVPNGGSAPLLPMLAQDTAYGDVLLDVTGGNLTIASALTYAGAHNLTLETGGSLN